MEVGPCGAGAGCGGHRLNAQNGSQGHAHALNLRDSGLDVVVSELEGTPNYEQAKKDGFTPMDAKKAAQKADIIQILTQDHVQAEVYKKSIKRQLKAGKSLVFSHGFNIIILSNTM